MTPERWREIELLYHSVRECEARERVALLAGSDPEIRSQVERMLAQDSGEKILDRPATELLDESTVTRLAAGALLGHYRIETPIGEGGMGVVYRARDTKLNRPVAIKVLSDELSDASARRRFQREAQMASSLNHPHILTVYDEGEFEGRQYLVTEYVDGGTLKEWARKEKRTWRQIVDLLVGVADGLATAHGAGILHRDIKPDNILISKSGYAKLADFGLAKLTEDAQVAAGTRSLTDKRTQPGMVIGTIAYMSPEQASGKPLDARSDLFSFGVVLYEMIAGHKPFAGATDLEVLQTIIHGTPQPLGDEIPVALRAVVEKALERDPGERYQSMREMVVDLRRLTRQSGKTLAMAAPLPTRSYKWAIAAAMIVVAGATGWWWISVLHPRATPQIRSIAVLPLRNLSGDPDQEYFAGGMTEALTTGLAQISALNVISRTSVMRYQGTQKTAPEIARELHVDSLVEGSVQRSGGRVLITVQLIEGTSDRHLWAKTYERGAQDALVLQNEVAQAIAGEIRVKLTPQEQTRLSAPHPVHPEAEEAYLRAQYWHDQGNPVKWREYLQRAIQRDPGYAQAYASLADCYGALIYVGVIPAKEGYPEWRASVTTALRLDDNLADAHRSLAALLAFHDWNWRDSEQEYRRALQLNPNLADAHLWLADVLAATGRLEEAVAEAKRGLQLNPNSVAEVRRMGFVLLWAKRPDEAVEFGQKMLDVDKASAHYILGLAYEQKGNLEQAIREFQDAVKLNQGDLDITQGGPASLAHAYAVSGRKPEALRIIAEMKALSKKIRVDPAFFAIIFAGLGDKNQVFEWLDRGYDDRPSITEVAKVEPRLEPMHSDPRFPELLRKMGLPE